jgi:alpha-beta hydrolase superfamily lysophospholipase
MKRLAFLLLATLVIGYLSICVLTFTQQRKLLFPAPTERTPIVGESVVVDVPGGTHFLWRQVEGDGPVVVHFHGNGEQVSNAAWLAEAFAVQGISFAAVEYPGYAGTPGEPSEASLIAAATAALAHLTGRMGITKQRLVLSGQSVGTGVAVTMAAKGCGHSAVAFDALHCVA